MDSTPEIQACLVPKLRFFKVYNDADSYNLEEIEFAFDNKYGTQGVMDSSDKIWRGGQSGIKEFSWSFEGTTPATARNDIKASLTLFFQEFSEFVKVRHEGDNFVTGGTGRKYRFIELCLLPGNGAEPDGDGINEAQNLNTNKRPTIHPHQYDPTHHRIRVDIGWVIRDDAEFARIVSAHQQGDVLYQWNSTQFNEALSLINKSFYLNMVEHDLSFKEDGTFEIKIEYRAYLESVLKTTELDALTTPQLAYKRQLMRKEYDSIIDKAICSEEDYEGDDGQFDKNDPDALRQILATYDAIRDEHLKEAHRSILNRLIRRQRLFYCYLDQRDVNDFNQEGYFRKKPRLYFPNQKETAFVKADAEVPYEEEAATGSDEIELTFSDTSLKDFVDPATEEVDTPTELINFFYIGDILHTIMDCMHEPSKKMNSAAGPIKKHMRNTKFLLSTFQYLDDKNQLREANIAEIPVAAEYFFEWMTEQVVRSLRKSYPITFFIRDLCNKIIVELMGELCLNKQLDKQLRFNTANFLGEGTAEGLDFFDALQQNGYNFLNTAKINVSEAYADGHIPLNSNIEIATGINGKTAMNNMYNYFVIYAVTAGLAHSGEGKFDMDGYKGTYHVQIGADRGIVKRYNFEKTDIQFIREARYFNKGHDGLLQLGAVYKVKIDMIGNTLFFPGMEVFIDPRGMGGEDFDPTDTSSYANKLGLGGYHIITRAEGSIGPGKFNSAIEAQFVYSGDGQGTSYGIGARNAQTGEAEPINETTNNDILSDSLGQSADTFCEKIIVVAQKRLRDIHNDQYDGDLTADEAALDKIMGE